MEYKSLLQKDVALVVSLVVEPDLEEWPDHLADEGFVEDGMG